MIKKLKIFNNDILILIKNEIFFLKLYIMYSKVTKGG